MYDSSLIFTENYGLSKQGEHRVASLSCTYAVRARHCGIAAVDDESSGRISVKRLRDTQICRGKKDNRRGVRAVAEKDRAERGKRNSEDWFRHWSRIQENRRARLKQ